MSAKLADIIREHVVHLMQAAYGLRDHGAKAPGGEHSLSGKAILMAAGLLEAAAQSISLSLRDEIDAESESIEDNTGVEPVHSSVESVEPHS